MWNRDQGQLTSSQVLRLCHAHVAPTWVVSTLVQERGEWVMHTEELSYFSRLAEAFGRLALVKTNWWGIETAKAVCDE